MPKITTANQQQYNICTEKEFFDAINSGKINELKEKLYYPSTYLETKTQGNTPLHIAVRRKHTDIVEWLLKEGCNPNSKSDDNHTPLYWAVQQGRKDIIALLANSGASLKIDPPLLHKLINFSDTDSDKIKFLLNVFKDEVNDFINLSSEDGKDRTPLHLAIYKTQAAVASLLISAGANLNAKDKEGKTPLHLILGAFGYGNTSSLAKLLLDKGAIVNTIDNQGNTPLHIVAGNVVSFSNPQQIEILRTLLSGNANVNAINHLGRTPLHHACLQPNSYQDTKDIDMIRVLMLNGASINLRDHEGNTPLHLAVVAGNPRTTQLLLENGADPTITNASGKTPAQLALSKDSIKDAKGFNRIVGASQEIASMLLSTEITKQKNNFDLLESQNSQLKKNIEAVKSGLNNLLDNFFRMDNEIQKNRDAKWQQLEKNIQQLLFPQNSNNNNRPVFPIEADKQVIEEMKQLLQARETSQQALAEKIKISADQIEELKLQNQSIFEEYRTKSEYLKEQQRLLSNGLLKIFYKVSERKLNFAFMAAGVLLTGMVERTETNMEKGVDIATQLLSGVLGEFDIPGLSTANAIISIVANEAASRIADAKEEKKQTYLASDFANFEEIASTAEYIALELTKKFERNITSPHAVLSEDKMLKASHAIIDFVIEKQLKQNLLPENRKSPAFIEKIIINIKTEMETGDYFKKSDTRAEIEQILGMNANVRLSQNPNTMYRANSSIQQTNDNECKCKCAII